MVQHVATVAFEGVEARPVDVQVQIAPGLPTFNLVGLADKAVSEARARVRVGPDASLAPVAGAVPAAVAANARNHGLICPAACGPEAAWASPEMEILAP